MFDIPTINTCLFGNVGLRQVQDPDLTTYDVSLTSSDSGLYVQNMHKLMTDENIEQALPDFKCYNHPSWDISTSYVAGEIVKYNDLFYESLTANTGSQPDSSPSDWRLKDYKSEFLTNMFKESDSRLLNKVFTLKKMRMNTKTVQNDIRVFEGAGRIQDKEINRGDLVGLKLRMEPQTGLKLRVRKIGLQFSSVESFNIYVYHTSQPEAPIQTIPVNVSTPNNFQWKEQIIDLEFDSIDHDAGGAFYIAYFQDDLNGQAIIKNHDYSKTPCKSCDRRHWSSYNLYNRLVDICPFSVDSEELSGTSMWDLSKERYVTKRNFRLNLAFSIECDLSDWICDNMHIMSEVQAKHRALGILEQIAYNTRDNGLAQKIKQMAQVELKGRTDIGMKPFHKEIEQDIKALSSDFSDLNSVCLPCERKGIKRRTA